MGISASFLKKLHNSQDWEDYVQQKWRSERVRELDRYGGLERPPVARGGSITAKLEFLGNAVHAQGNAMEDALYAKPTRSAQSVTHVSAFSFSTDRRMQQRQKQLDSDRTLPRVAELADLDLKPQGNGVSMTTKMRKGAPAPSLLPPGAHPVPGVAPWRIRIFHARRNAIIVVQVCTWLRRGLKHPQRMRRCESFSFAIPGAFGDDCARFVEEAHQFQEVREAVDAAKLALSEAMKESHEGPKEEQAVEQGAVPEAEEPQAQQQEEQGQRHEEQEPLPLLPLPVQDVDAEGGGDSTKVSKLKNGDVQHMQRTSWSPEHPRPAAVLPHTENRRRSLVEQISMGKVKRTTNRQNSADQVILNGHLHAAMSGLPQVRLLKKQQSDSTGLMALPKNDSVTAGSPLQTLPETSLLTQAIPSPGHTSASSEDGSPSVSTPPTGSLLAHLQQQSQQQQQQQQHVHGGRPHAVSDSGNGVSRSPLSYPSPHARSSTGGNAPPSSRLTLPPLKGGDSPAQSPLAGDRPQYSPLSKPPVPLRKSPPESEMPPLPPSLVNAAASSNALAAAVIARHQDAIARHKDSVRMQASLHGEGPPHRSAHRSAQPRGGTGGYGAAGNGWDSNVRTLPGAEPAPLHRGTPHVTSDPLTRLGGGGVLSRPIRSATQQPLRAVHSSMPSSRDVSPVPQGKRKNARRSLDSAGTRDGPGSGSRSSPPSQARAASGRSMPPSGADGAAGARRANGKVANGGAPHERDLRRTPSGAGGAPGQAAGAATPPQDPSGGYSLEQLDGLKAQYESECERLRGVEQRLLMYVNRANSAWASSQDWGMPDVWSGEEVELWSRSNASRKFKDDMGYKVAAGQIAVMVMTGDDVLRLPDGSSCSIWCSDPWDLLDTCRPGLVPRTSRIEGVTYGGRVLCQLVAAVRAEGGDAAVSKLPVVLHLDNEWQEVVCKDLWDHDFYGLSRQNVLLVSQPKKPGYLYEQHADGGFVRQEGAHEQPAGSGYSMMQMAWTGEAFLIDEQGVPMQLPGTVLESLEARGVTWLLSRRARDMSLLSPGGLLDLQQLSYTAFLREQARATMTLECISTESLALTRQWDSVILCNRSLYRTYNPDGSLSALSSSMGMCEMHHAELQSSRPASALLTIKATSGGKLSVGLGRYTYHLPSLKALLTSHSSFRPKLLLSPSGLVHVRLEASDLSCHPATHCLAVAACQNHGLLMSPEDLQGLLPLLQAHDIQADFKAVVKSSFVRLGARFANARLSMESLAGVLSAKRPLRTTVVFLSSHPVSHMSLAAVAALSRPGRDVVRLVTFVSDEAHRDRGQQLLSEYQDQVAGALLEMYTDVVVRGPYGLLERMEMYLDEVQPKLLIMGSGQLTAPTANYAVGSVTVALLRRVSLPVLVVTANSRHIETSKTKLRMLGIVDPLSRPMLNHMCTYLMDKGRSDLIMLGQVIPHHHLTQQQQITNRRVLESCVAATATCGVSAHRTTTLEGQFDRVLAQAVEGSQIAVVGVPVARRQVPQHLISLMRSCKAAVLVHPGP